MAEEDIKKIIEKVNSDTTIVEPVVQVENPEKPGFDMDGEAMIVVKEDSKDEASVKRDAAFAKMRIENKTKDTNIKALQAKIDALEAGKPTPKVETKPDEKELTATDKKIADLEAKLDEITNSNTKKAQDAHVENIRSNLDSLKTKYVLSDNDMMDFAEQAETAGYSLGANPLMIENIYRTLNVDKLVASELARAKKELETNKNRSPGVGPKGTLKSKGGMSPLDVIAAIAAKNK